MRQIRFLSTNKITPITRFIQDLARRKMIVESHPMFPYKNQDISTYASTLPNVLYTGFDPTSDSFHIGNLLVITSLIRSSIFGCTPIALIGEGTAIVGDPSGHTTDRKQQSRDVLHKNAKSLLHQIERIFSNAQSLCGTSLQFKILNNIDWYNDMKMLDFMMMSKRYRVGEMLRLAQVKSRLDNGLTLAFSEFSYQILQSYDWYMLSKRHDCYCQLGGSDQLGNLKTGFEHIRAESDHLSLGVCIPLLTDGSGNKIGKSSIKDGDTGFWLCPSRTSSFAFYQYFRQLHDDIAENLLLQFSLRPLEEIKRIIKEHRQNLGKWIAQKELANELTQLVHGEDGLQIAIKCSDLLFNGSFQLLEDLDPETIRGLFGSASTVLIPRNSIQTVGELAEKIRPGGAKKMKEGALRINGVKMQNPDQMLELPHILIQNQFSLACWGKRKFSLIVWT